ncbi:MAG: ribosome-binding factor A [Gammaproteobacteria bacterium]|nr:ribosome-binding factor A [Gammaproteobacteria bacterium]
MDLFDSLPYKRSQRVSDSIKKEVASIFLFKVNDPRLRNITITNVVLSDDLSNAKIFYSTINLKDEEVSIKKALDKSRGFIRTMLGKSISLKKIPTISFFKDDI